MKFEGGSVKSEGGDELHPSVFTLLSSSQEYPPPGWTRGKIIIDFLF
jgi:hypothetical protein